MAGYHILVETLLARRFGATGAAAGLTVAGTCAAALFFGAEILSSLPIGLFAAVIWYLGLDLMVTAIRDHGLRMPLLDLAIVLVTPLIALVVGFMAAVAFGVVVATLLFVIAYSSVDAVRLSTTGANFHARVERRPEHHSRLSELGGCVQIHKLEGFLFFGSASRLVERLQKDLEVSPAPRFAIVDLKRVVGLDMSAWAAFERLARSCTQHGTKLILSGLSPRLKQSFGYGPMRDQQARFELADDLDEVLLRIEENLLETGDDETGAPSDSGDGFELGSEFADILKEYGCRMTLSPGDVVLAEGVRSDHLLFLLAGRCRASVTDRNGVSHTVNRMLPGAIFGEIAFYAGVPRTTTVVAETPATAVRIDAASLNRMERDDPVLAARFHRSMAAVLSRRLTTITRLLNDAEV
jgi:SulP family sulfate permease